jgi:hypothetical protein
MVFDKKLFIPFQIIRFGLTSAIARTQRLEDIGKKQYLEL